MSYRRTKHQRAILTTGGCNKITEVSSSVILVNCEVVDNATSRHCHFKSKTSNQLQVIWVYTELRTPESNKLTLSVGVTSLKVDDDNIDNILHRADQLLYETKIK